MSTKKKTETPAAKKTININESLHARLLKQVEKKETVLYKLAQRYLTQGLERDE